MSEPNLTEDEVRELHKLMPKPDDCPHGELPAHSSVFGKINACNRCFHEAKKKLAEQRALLSG